MNERLMAANVQAVADRSEWDRAFATMQRAKRISDEESARFDPIYDRYNQEPEAVPHIVLRPDAHTGRTEPVTTADVRFGMEARSLVKAVAEGRCRLETDRYPSLGEHLELCREFVAADEQRHALIKRIDARLGYSAAVERSEQACETYVDAAGELLGLPSPDGAALLWKLDYLWLGDESAGWHEDVVSLVLADARRLLNTGRA